MVEDATFNEGGDDWTAMGSSDMSMPMAAAGIDSF